MDLQALHVFQRADDDFAVVLQDIAVFLGERPSFADRLCECRLERIAHGERHVLLDCLARGAHTGRSNEPADLPPGDVECLPGRRNRHDALRTRVACGNRLVVVVVEHQVFVNLIREDPCVHALCRSVDAVERLSGEHGPGGVVG